ncbi:MAG: hypothetical protein Q4A82_01670 [Corynebacterium sp.]|nr:hypothetical protein [Corynebacterium sp.]
MGNELAKAVSAAVDNALTNRIREPRYRVFRNGLMDYEACIKAAKEWIPDSGRPDLALRSIFGDGAVLAINGIAQWNHEVRDAISSILPDLNSKISNLNNKLIDSYTFISSSEGSTAFGAHIDFEDSVIVDLAGCGRVIRTWKPGADFGAILPGAPTHFGTSMDWYMYSEDSSVAILSPGDIGVIAANEPHIFHALGPGFFSVYQ